jgi:hypothetical protein
MLASFLFVVAAASITPLGPELIMPEPITSGAQLLRALSQAEDDFAKVQGELGLVGSAPLVGMKVDKPTPSPAVSRASKPRVKKAAAKIRR